MELALEYRFKRTMGTALSQLREASDEGLRRGDLTESLFDAVVEMGGDSVPSTHREDTRLLEYAVQWWNMANRAKAIAFWRRSAGREP